VTAFNIQQAVSAMFESSGIDFPTFFQALDESLQGDASIFGASSSVPSNINIVTGGSVILECGDNSWLFIFWTMLFTDLSRLPRHHFRAVGRVIE
jgi:hypothetical protein